MPYPQYTEEQDARRKLSMADIALLRKMRKRGTLRELAHLFNVSPNTISYWVNEQCRERARARGRAKRTTAAAVKRCLARKQAIMPDAWRAYRRELQQRAKKETTHDSRG